MLLKLSRIVNFNAAIRPACLPTQYAVSDENVIATGWGTMEGGTQSNVLMKATLNIFSQEACNVKYPLNVYLNDGIVDEIHLCAGSFVDSKDTCAGDSGGPIQTSNEDDDGCIYTIVGVTSFGLAQCGIQGYPGVYARVYTYLSWIEEHVWPNQ